MRVMLFSLLIACQETPGTTVDGAADDAAEPPADAAEPPADAAAALEYGSSSGVAHIVYSPGFPRERLKVHMTTVGPGMMAHAPHTHGGDESFYVLSGQAELTLDQFTEPLAAGDAAIFEGRFLHGLRNSSTSEDLSYLVIRTE